MALKLTRYAREFSQLDVHNRADVFAFARKHDATVTRLEQSVVGTNNSEILDLVVTTDGWAPSAQERGAAAVQTIRDQAMAGLRDSHAEFRLVLAAFDEWQPGGDVDEVHSAITVWERALSRLRPTVEFGAGMRLVGGFVVTERAALWGEALAARAWMDLWTKNVLDLTSAELVAGGKEDARRKADSIVRQHRLGLERDIDRELDAGVPPSVVAQRYGVKRQTTDSRRRKQAR